MLALLAAFQATQELVSLQQVLKIVAAAVCSAMTRLAVVLVMLEARVTKAVFSTSVLMICRAGEKAGVWRAGQWAMTRLAKWLAMLDAKVTQEAFFKSMLMICRAIETGFWWAGPLCCGLAEASAVGQKCWQPGCGACQHLFSLACTPLKGAPAPGQDRHGC